MRKQQKKTAKKSPKAKTKTAAKRGGKTAAMKTKGKGKKIRVVARSPRAGSVNASLANIQESIADLGRRIAYIDVRVAEFTGKEPFHIPSESGSESQHAVD